MTSRPAENDTLSSPSEILNLTFDEIIAPSSVNTQHIALQQIGSSIQSLTLQTWTWRNRSGVNVYPTKGLLSGTPYRIRVYGIRDYAGNSILSTDALLWSFAVAPQAYTTDVLENFEAGTTGWADPTTHPASEGFSLDSTSWQSRQHILLPFTGNTSAGLLAYKWDTTASKKILRLSPDSALAPIIAGHARMQVHVWGDGNGTQLRFAFKRISRSGEDTTDVRSPAIPISWVGWRLYDYALDVDSLGVTLGDSADAGLVLFEGIDVLYGGTESLPSGQLVFDDLQIARKIITGVRAEPVAGPDAFVLGQNYPNPFNPSTLIPFSVPVTGRILLAVYDVLGREVAVLEDGVVLQGSHTARFDARLLPSGMYFAELRTEGFRHIRKMIFLK
jgi:hypothetical protein